MTKVDIFIPHWGSTGKLQDAVSSVLEQDDPRWNLTIIDDATPGSEGAATQEYFADLNAMGDSRIRTVTKARNEGITANFRTCAQSATAPIVTIMGNDDLLLPNYVGTVLHAHESYPEADIIQPDVLVVDSQGKPKRTLVDAVKQSVLRPRSAEPLLVEGDGVTATLMHGDWLYWPSLCFSREVLQRYDFRDGFAVIQDLALLTDMLLGGAKILVLPKSGDRNAASFAYRRHDESASSTALFDGSRFSGEREFYKLAARLAGARNWGKTVLAARLHLTSRAHALTLLPSAVLRGRLRDATDLLRHAFGS